MNHTPPSDESIDRLLSEFLKAQMPQPWPAAPATAATSEPSVLVASRAGATEAPRNQPAVPRDTSARSRFTLAASVALLLGTCWTLSNGFQSGDRPATGPNGSNGPGVNLHDTTAEGKGGLPGAIANEKDKKGNPPVKVDNPFGP
jgi:hypothetical protein